MTANQVNQAFRFQRVAQAQQDVRKALQDQREAERVGAWNTIVEAREKVNAALDEWSARKKACE